MATMYNRGVPQAGVLGDALALDMALGTVRARSCGRRCSAGGAGALAVPAGATAEQLDSWMLPARRSGCRSSCGVAVASCSCGSK